MYLEASNEFKNAVKSNSITSTARLTFKEFFSDGTDLVIGEENITQDGGLTIMDFCYNDNNGQLIGTTMTKEVEIEIKNPNNYELEGKTFDLEVGVLTNYEKMTYEYIKYGAYVVTSYEDLKSSKKYRLIAYDLMSKLNAPYIENTSFVYSVPITLKEFYRKFMKSYGIEIEEQDLPNQNFVIRNVLDFEGATGRTVLGYIAQLFGSFAKINRNNKCQMYLKTETEEEIDLNQMNTSLEIDNRYGPVNVVSVGLSQVEGENVTLQDVDSVLEHGEITIRIDDNPIVYTEELREEVIGPLFERLNGFTYIPVKFKMKALFYTDCGDSIRVRNIENNEFVDTIVLNQKIRIPQTRQSTIESKALTNTEQKNKYISKTKQAQSRTEIIVDKNNKIIESVVELTTEQNEKINRITQTVDELNSKISDVADLTISAQEINAKVMLDDINESEPVRVVIRPTGENISLLYPRNNLFPSNTLFPKTRILRFENTTTQEIFDYEIPDDLYFYNTDYYDEFILDYESQTCLINKKVGFNENGETYILENPRTIDYEYPKINLTSGNYTVSILGYNYGYLFVRLMATNIYTTQFATKAELTSEIKQLSDEISLEVSQKVNSDEIIAGLNIAVKNKQGILELVGNVLKIVTDNFNLTSDGHMTAKAGDIAGWTINENYLGKGLAGIKGISNTTSNDDAFYAGKGLGYNGNPAFHVTNQGNTYVKSLNIKGKDASDTGEINVYDVQGQVGTNIKASEVDTYHLIAGNGGTTPTKGKAMHGYDMYHDYRCNWQDSKLYFIIDDYNMGYVTSSSSDARLKKDIKDIPQELMLAIEEIELKQFKLIKGNGKYKFGIIAQDLVSAFTKYDLDYRDFEVISETQIDLTDETLYFTIDYEQILILKNQLLENKLKALEDKVEKILKFMEGER